MHAEADLEQSNPTARLTLLDAQAWVERVAHSEDIDPPLVIQRRLGRRVDAVALHRSHVIVVRHARPSQLTLLHELTHCIGHMDHGASFQHRYAELVSRHVSVEHGAALRRALAG